MDLPLQGSGSIVASAHAAIEGPARARLGPFDAEAFLARARRRLPDAVEALAILFGARAGFGPLVDSLLATVLDYAVSRSAELKLLDHRREIEPDWFQSHRTVGYVCYVDRFSGSLASVAEHLDLLDELGVTYLHLMPLLRPRPGQSDGGYAVMDYRSVDPALGTMDDLAALAGLLRGRGISLCIDVVINHTAREHEWAAKARGGDLAYRDYYLSFPDRTVPDRYEETVRDVFPDFAPGSFTWDDDLQAWVWTTFNDFQWDLNHANPAVFSELLDVMLFLAGQGVEILRLDAVPFTWKRMGTDCENQPEAHLLLQAWRALVAIAAPAVVFKAEAIVPPDDLVPYLGAHPRFRPECDLAYHNQLMVLLWNCLATKDAQLANHALARMTPIPPSTSWVTYVRGHDDIGWAISDADAWAAGFDPWAHRRFLADFYTGRFPGSFARGLDFQPNPVTGDVRTSGSSASLCGIEAALGAGDSDALALAVRRLVLLHSVAISFGGTPLLYMGDELALRNDTSYLTDPARVGDDRWIHRPPMDWVAAARRHDPSTLEGEVFGWFVRLLDLRRSTEALHGGAPAELWSSGHDSVFAYRRRHPRSAPFLAIVNVGDRRAAVDHAVLAGAGVSASDLVLGSGALDGARLQEGAPVVLPPVSFAWFAGR